MPPFRAERFDGIAEPDAQMLEARLDGLIDDLYGRMKIVLPEGEPKDKLSWPKSQAATYQVEGQTGQDCTIAWLERNNAFDKTCIVLATQEGIRDSNGNIIDTVPGSRVNQLNVGAGRRIPSGSYYHDLSLEQKAGFLGAAGDTLTLIEAKNRHLHIVQ